MANYEHRFIYYSYIIIGGASLGVLATSGQIGSMTGASLLCILEGINKLINIKVD